MALTGSMLPSRVTVDAQPPPRLLEPAAPKVADLEAILKSPPLAVQARELEAKALAFEEQARLAERLSASIRE